MLFVGEETIENVVCWKLNLKSVDRGVTYSRVVLFVEKETNRPKFAEFYSMSGKLLKTATYGDYKMMLGKIRPTKLIMKDALKEDDVSVLTYQKMELKDFPDKYFTKDYMKRIADE